MVELPPLTLERVPIDSLYPDPANVRLHDERNLRAVMASLQRFGQRTPITIDADRIIRKGNATWEAMKRLGWAECYIAPWTERGSEATAYAITDNRTSELSIWDLEPLSQQLAALQAEGFDLEALGWTQADLDPLLAAQFEHVEFDAATDDFVALGRPIACTAEQRQVIDQAIARVRAHEGQPKLSDGRCLELICIDWLQTPYPDGADES